MSTKKSKTRGIVSSGLKLADIEPMCEAQVDMIESWNEGYNLFLHGFAGAGKSLVALYLGMKELINNSKYEKLVIIRSAVPSRDSGFLPGTLEEKTKIYELPYESLFCKLYNGRKDAYNLLKEKGLVEFSTTSYMRGLTIDKAIVVFDECQNFTFQEADTGITRIGDNCRVIFCGDIDQTDLNKKQNDKTGLREFIEIVKNMDEFDFIEFTEEDIVRSGFVKSYIIQKKRLGFGN